jgi:hypothetical protein
LIKIQFEISLIISIYDQHFFHYNCYGLMINSNKFIVINGFLLHEFKISLQPMKTYKFFIDIVE